MKQRITLWTVAAAALLALSACSAPPAPQDPEVSSPPAAQEAPAEETAPTETPASVEPAELDAATIQACQDMAGPFAEASAGMLNILSDSKIPPQEVVDMWTLLVEALGKISETATVQEVKEAAAVAYTDFAALRDAMQKVYVEGDFAAMSDYLSATQAIEDSYPALLALCSPEADS